MPKTNFKQNVNTVSKAEFGQIAHNGATTTTSVNTVVSVITKLESDIIKGPLPTTAQLSSIAAVLTKLETTGNTDPLTIKLLKTCLDLVTHYTTISNSLSSTLARLESAQFKASLLEDATKLKAYLLNRGVSVFPPQTITVQNVQVAQAVAIHIREFGLPIQMTKLAMIEQNLQNRQLTLDGTILSMIHQFIETLTFST